MFTSLRLVASSLALILSTPWVAAFETTAQAAFVFDQGTGTVLLAKNADEAMPPASMSKLMTLYMAFEAVRDGRLTLDQRLPVSQHAKSLKGSTMFLDTRDRVRVEDLLRGIVVMSGNDASVVIAEALSPDGTEAGFSRFMTERAKQLGMTNSNLVNSSGWPADGHLMSMRDLGILADRLITDFPGFYPLFAETEFAFDGRAPANTRNRNPLLNLGIGADGLKTGHTMEAGFGLVGSALRGERRVIFVINGLDSRPKRAREAEAIVNWSFSQFAEKTIARAGTQIARAEVWMGAERTVGLVPAEDFRVLLPILAGDKISAEVVYTGPVNAPIYKGQQLAELVLQPDDMPELRLPLVAEKDVAAGGVMVRVRTAAGLLIARFTAAATGAL